MALGRGRTSAGRPKTALVAGDVFRFIMGAASALLLAASGAFVFDALAKSDTGSPSGTTSIIAIGGLFLASVATFTGVYFGWRKDRREARLLQMQIEKLQSQTAQDQASRCKESRS
jgi:hypothetical protein